MKTVIGIYENLPEVGNAVHISRKFRSYYRVSIHSVNRVKRYAEKHAFWKASNAGNVKIWKCAAGN